MFRQNNIVLIGNSVVEQSKSIAHLNKRVINIDSFNDRDLKGENYKNSDPYGLVNDDVISILQSLELAKEDTLILVSSGYDSSNNFYEQLKKFGMIISNNYKSISDIQNNSNLIAKLKSNNIKTPEIFSLEQSKKEEKVIIKNSSSSGGFGIKIFNKSLNQDTLENYEYCQKFIKGQTYSILFISNKDKKFEIVGVNKIFNKKTLHTNFCFSGAKSNIKLNKKQIQYLERVIEFFITEYELIGLNGIDFIISKDIYFLEINPRITQTCFLYNNSFEHGFIKAHIDAFLNKDLPSIKTTGNTSVAFETLFSNTKFIFNHCLLGYDFISNIPEVNTSINVGDPICTVNVTSEDGKKVNKLLSDNISLIKNKLTNIEII